MYRCTINDEGLSVTTETIEKTAEYLYDYINENYGKHVVEGVKDKKTYMTCASIRATGEYIIKTKARDIHCVIYSE